MRPGNLRVPGRFPRIGPEPPRDFRDLPSFPIMTNYLPTVLRSVALLATAATLLAQDADTAAAPAVPRRDPVIKLGTGFDYSRGKYGFTQATEVTSVPVNLSYDLGRWAFKANLPYMTIKGPASVVAGPTPVAGPGRPTTQSQSGMGDPTISTTFHARPVPGEWNIDLTGRMKIAAADDEKGLGTGENDYYLQFDSYRTYGTFTPFISAGYRFLGSNPTYQLKDGPYASIGGSFRVGTGTIVGAAFDWRSKIIDSAPDGTDMIGFFATDLAPRWNLLGYVLIGFNEASPDFGVGSAITYKF